MLVYSLLEFFSLVLLQQLFFLLLQPGISSVTKAA